MSKGATETIWIGFVAIPLAIILLILGGYFLSRIPKEGQSLWDYIKELFITTNEITGPRAELLVDAIKCSYYRCDEGCNSQEVRKMSDKSYVDENSWNCSDYCKPEWTDTGTINGKICNDNSKYHPVIVSIKYEGIIERKTIEEFELLEQSDCKKVFEEADGIPFSTISLPKSFSCEKDWTGYIKKCEIPSGTYYVWGGATYGIDYSVICDKQPMPDRFCNFIEPNLCGHQYCKGNPLEWGAEYSNICCVIGKSDRYDNGPDDAPCFSTDTDPLTPKPNAVNENFAYWSFSLGNHLKNVLVYQGGFGTLTPEFEGCVEDRMCRGWNIPEELKTAKCEHNKCTIIPGKYYGPYIFFRLMPKGMSRPFYGLKIIGIANRGKVILDVYLHEKSSNTWFTLKQEIDFEPGKIIKQDLFVKEDEWAWNDIDALLLAYSDKSDGEIFDEWNTLDLYYVGLLTKDRKPFCTSGYVDNGIKCYYGMECPSVGNGWTWKGVDTTVGSCDCESTRTCGMGYCQVDNKCFYGVKCGDDGWEYEGVHDHCVVCSAEGCEVEIPEYYCCLDSSRNPTDRCDSICVSGYYAGPFDKSNCYNMCRSDATCEDICGVCLRRGECLGSDGKCNSDPLDCPPTECCCLPSSGSCCSIGGECIDRDFCETFGDCNSDNLDCSECCCLPK